MTAEARAEFYKELANLKKKAHDKIAEGLTEEQKGKLNELIGETYDSTGEHREFLKSIDETRKKSKRE